MATGINSSLLNAGDFEYDFPCTECQEHGLNSEAIYFCHNCSSQFCGQCIKTHGRFYQKHPIIGTEKRNSWGRVKNTCKLHPGEEMVVFCSDHGQPCCGKCQKELHRQCKQVISLQHSLPKPQTRPVAGKSGHTAVPTHSAKIPFKQKHAKSQVVTDTDHKRPYKLIERKVKIHKDKHSCSVYGITVLPGGEIVLTDAANSKLKLLSADYTVVDHVSVPQEPWGICAVSDNYVAVCNRSKEIQFYNVINSKLKMDRTLQMEHICRYVSYMAGHLYISSKDTVYKYTLAGQRVRKIYTLNGECMWGIAVSPDGGRLYVTDVDNHQLVTVDMHGRVLAILKDEELRFPEGVCVSPSGRVIVCGWKSGTILQVDSSGNHKLATLANKKDGVSSPLSVFFDSRTSSLIVGQEYTDHLLVLVLK